MLSIYWGVTEDCKRKQDEIITGIPKTLER